VAIRKLFQQSQTLVVIHFDDVRQAIGRSNLPSDQFDRLEIFDAHLRRAILDLVIRLVSQHPPERGFPRRIGVDPPLVRRSGRREELPNHSPIQHDPRIGIVVVLLIDRGVLHVDFQVRERLGEELQRRFELARPRRLVHALDAVSKKCEMAHPRIDHPVHPHQVGVQQKRRLPDRHHLRPIPFAGKLLRLWYEFRRLDRAFRLCGGRRRRSGRGDIAEFVGRISEHRGKLIYLDFLFAECAERPSVLPQFQLHVEPRRFPDPGRVELTGDKKRQPPPWTIAAAQRHLLRQRPRLRQRHHQHVRILQKLLIHHRGKGRLQRIQLVAEVAIGKR
jgi:hypothetical protein